MHTLALRRAMAHEGERGATEEDRRGGGEGGPRERERTYSPQKTGGYEREGTKLALCKGEEGKVCC